MATPSFYLGAWKPLDGHGDGSVARLSTSHLVTHSVIVGTRGSGKTGLVTVAIEEAMRAKVPVIALDVKGCLLNLLLAFPQFDPADLIPWLEPSMTHGASLERVARVMNDVRRRRLQAWSIGEAELKAYVEGCDYRIITPGSSAGEELRLLSSLERSSQRWDSDAEAARDVLSATMSFVLHRMGREADPTKSREHVLLSVLAEMRLRRGRAAGLGALVNDLTLPSIDRVGALGLDGFLSQSERRELAVALSTLLASPAFGSWRDGTALHFGEWIAPRDGRTQAAVVSVAHLDESERAWVVGVLLEELLLWVRALPTSSRLRAMLVLEDIDSYFSNGVTNPRLGSALSALLKQAPRHGVGIVSTMQNPLVLDDGTLGSAGLWCVGRLQSDATHFNVCDRIAPANQLEHEAPEISQVLERLPHRWFLARDAHTSLGTRLLQPRCPLSLMRGPLSQDELRFARQLPHLGSRFRTAFDRVGGISL